MDEKQGGYRLGYRADVEGLRAVAILLVVAAHAHVGVLRGGFIGVDVFYILSGYLITGLLVQEIATTGRLRFANFYARRLRRLLPALLLMLAVTCVVAQLVVPPTQLPIQASNASTAVLWLSNFQFALWNWDYFAPTADVALFLHTWSLGVEEQFYLIWPLLMLLAMGTWKRATHGSNIARLQWLFGGIFIASFALSLYWTYRAPMFAFYLMPSRAWQFALGALVFFAVGSPAFRMRPAIANSWWLQSAGWAGLGMILFGAWFIDPGGPYPGTWALVPSFGAALVLAAGACRHNVGVQSVLSWRPLQALGRVSYSWYLWHWPVLLLGALLLDATNGWNQLFLVVVSLVIAALSYHFFETPIRHSRQLVVRPRVAIAGALAIMVLAAVVFSGWKADTARIARGPTLARFVSAESDRSVIYAMGCSGLYETTKVQVCSFGNSHAKHTVVILGDSKAAHWVPAYRKIFDEPDWRLLVITKSACPMVDAPYIAPPLRREYTECGHWRADALRKVASMQPDVIVLGESVNYPFTQRQWILGTQQILRTLSSNARRVYLMRPTPDLPFNGRLCAEPRSRLYSALVGKSHCTSDAHTERFENIGQWLRTAAAPFHNVRVIDMTNSVCPGGVCRSEVDGVLVFSDSGHMTATFARTLAPDLEKALDLNGALTHGTTDHGPG